METTKHYLRAIWLFLRIVWRGSPAGGRMSVRLSWEVASIVHLSDGRKRIREILEMETNPEVRE